MKLPIDSGNESYASRFLGSSKNAPVESKVRCVTVLSSPTVRQVMALVALLFFPRRFPSPILPPFV